MKQDEIIEMAKQAGFGVFEGGIYVTQSNEYCTNIVEAFAKLVAARTLMNIDPRSFMSYQEGFEAGVTKERDACAKVCDELESAYSKRHDAMADDRNSKPVLYMLGKEITALNCAKAIRARGEA